MVLVNQIQSLLHLLQQQIQHFHDRDTTDHDDERLQKELRRALKERLIPSHVPSYHHHHHESERIMTRLEKDFVIGRKLGEGRFGVIHELEQSSKEQVYAVKRPHTMPLATRRMGRKERKCRQRQQLQNLIDFESELHILQAAHHPNIVVVHGTMGDKLLVMERLYDTLEERLDAWRLKKQRQTYYYSGTCCLEDMDLPIDSIHPQYSN